MEKVEFGKPTKKFEVEDRNSISTIEKKLSP
jgi:hypothetical protein